MQVLRTDETRFKTLSDYPFLPHYIEVGKESGMLARLQYLDEGAKDAEPIPCLYGQPSWCFLYRKIIPPLVAAGYRIIAPDLIGFRKSDRPGTDIITPGVSTILAQMYVTIPVPSAGDVAEQFAGGAPGAFLYWVKCCTEAPDVSERDVFGLLSRIDDQTVLDGYETPFSNQNYITEVRKFPNCVPLLPAGQPDKEKGDAAWAVLGSALLPARNAFNDKDLIMKGVEQRFIQRLKTRIMSALKEADIFCKETRFRHRPMRFSPSVGRLGGKHKTLQ